jgi:hypothetical protein
MTILLALVMGVVLPGIAGGVLLTSFSPDPSRPGALLTRALSCGVAAWLVSSGVLTRTIGLTETSSWATAALLTVASVVVLGLPRSRAVLRQALPEIGYLTALLAVTVITWLPVGVLIFRTTWGPLGSTPWYYWSLADKIARAGVVPDSTKEWGTTLPFLDDYQLFSSSTAMLLTQSDAAVRALHVVIFLSVVLMACGAALLANALGSGRLASLAAVPLGLATGIGAVRLTSYRPEAFALGLVLLLVALWVDWLRHGERGSFVAACLLAAVLAQVHGIALVTGGVFLVASIGAFFPRHDRFLFLRRCAVSAVALGVSALLMALALGGASGTEHAGQLGDESGLADPTWEFVRAIQGRPPSLPPDNQQIASNAVNGLYQGTGVWVGPLLAVATIVLMVGAIRQPLARQTLVFTLVSLAGLTIVASAFALGWSSYVPRRTGTQRLVQEATLLVGPYIACALACVPFFTLRVTWQKLTTAILVVGLCCAGLTASLRLEGIFARQRPDEGIAQALEELELPADAVVLTNAYTEGYIHQVTGAEGLLEGRAPYTFPRVLRRANSLLREAQAFFLDPAAHLAFLDKNHVSYVVVSDRDSYSLGTSNVFANPRPALLDKFRALEPVLTQPGLSVYRVEPSAYPWVAKSADGMTAKPKGDR